LEPLGVKFMVVNSSSLPYYLIVLYMYILLFTFSYLLRVIFNIVYNLFVFYLFCFKLTFDEIQKLI